MFSRRRQPVVTTTAPRRRGLFSSNRHHHHHTTGVTTTAGTRSTGTGTGLFSRRRHNRYGASSRPVVRQKRPTTIGDKISGALLKLKGTLTGRPGEKAAGTRRMHGTDGRGMTRRRRFF